MGIYFNPRFHFAFCICHGFYIAIPFLFALRIGDNRIVWCYFKNHYVAIQIGDYIYYEKTNTGYEWLKNIKELSECKILTIGTSSTILLEVEIHGRKKVVIICNSIPALTTTIDIVDLKKLGIRQSMTIAEFYEKLKPFVCHIGVFVAFYCFQCTNHYKKAANKLITNNRIDCLTKYQNTQEIYNKEYNDEIFI